MAKEFFASTHIRALAPLVVTLRQKQSKCMMCPHGGTANDSLTLMYSQHTPHLERISISTMIYASIFAMSPWVYLTRLRQVVSSQKQENIQLCFNLAQNNLIFNALDISNSATSSSIKLEAGKDSTSISKYLIQKLCCYCNSNYITFTKMLKF